MGLRSGVWWRCGECPTAGEWGALFAALTLGVAVIAAAIALVQLNAHFRSQWALSRPYVVVDFTFRAAIMMQVEIRNISTSAAADVRLTVNPPFESQRVNGAADALNEVFNGSHVISLLAPGRRILYSLDRAPDYFEAGLPLQYSVTATYRDALARQRRDWRWLGFRRTVVTYEDSFVLDAGQWKRATTETDYDNQFLNIAKRVEKQVNATATNLISIDASLQRVASAANPTPRTIRGPSRSSRKLR